MRVEASTSSVTELGEYSNCLLAQPSYANFSKVKIGTTSNRTVNLTNTLDYPLKVSILTYDSSFYTSRTILRLEPGQTRAIDITFRPTKEGFKSTQVRFMSDSSCHGQITVTGEGVKP